MKRRTRRLAVVTALGVAVAVAAVVLAALSRPRDLTRIQGTWVSGDRRVTFRGRVADVEWFSGKTERSYFRLEPSASPPRLVLIDANTPGVNEMRLAGRPELETRCLYDLTGDRLRVCLPSTRQGADFPTSFDPAAGGFVIEFLRE